VPTFRGLQHAERVSEAGGESLAVPATFRRERGFYNPGVSTPSRLRRRFLVLTVATLVALSGAWLGFASASGFWRLLPRPFLVPTPSLSGVSGWK
jgi:hypothetical protein